MYKMFLGLLLAASAALAIEIESDVVRSGDFEVFFKTDKKEYQVGDEVFFQVRSNKDFYLYLFDIKNDEFILPNAAQPLEKMKKNTDHTVPGIGVYFRVKEAGMHKVHMVASTKKLDIDFDAFSQGNKSNKSVGKFFGIGDKKKVSKRVEFMVADPEEAQADSAAGDSSRTVVAGDWVGTFVSTHQLDYKVGEVMKINYGADRDGVVSLFIEGPDGETTRLKQRRVRAGRAYQVKARAGEPLGEHNLRVVYEGEMAGSEAGKGIYMDENGSDERPHALYYFTIGK